MHSLKSHLSLFVKIQVDSFDLEVQFPGTLQNENVRFFLDTWLIIAKDWEQLSVVNMAWVSYGLK